MTEQEEFFSPSHKRLLSLAVWAKYLAWIVLVVYALWAVSVYFQERNIFFYYGAMGTAAHDNFSKFLKAVPSYAFGIFLEMTGTFLKGIVYFFVLRGISLGLNLIVETDINYRERERGAE